MKAYEEYCDVCEKRSKYVLYMPEGYSFVCSKKCGMKIYLDDFNSCLKELE